MLLLVPIILLTGALVAVILVPPFAGIGWGAKALDARLTAAGADFTHAWFPDTAVLSVINTMSDGSGVEIGTIGNEGFVGIGALLDAPTSLHLTIAQIPGMAHRIPMAVLVIRPKTAVVSTATPIPVSP